MSDKDQAVIEKFSEAPSSAKIEQVAAKLEQNGFRTQVVNDLGEAKAAALELIPEGSEVFMSASVTTDQAGLVHEFEETGKYDAIRPKTRQMDYVKDALEISKLQAAPEFVVGSVHAITEDGEVLDASRTGSQMPAYSSGAQNVVWLVGAQKIVKDVAEGIERIFSHALPLENQRSQKVYGMPSQVNTILIKYKEERPRVNIILIKQAVGF